MKKILNGNIISVLLIPIVLVAFYFLSYLHFEEVKYFTQLSYTTDSLVNNFNISINKSSPTKIEQISTDIKIIDDTIIDIQNSKFATDNIADININFLNSLKSYWLNFNTLNHISYIESELFSIKQNTSDLIARNSTELLAKLGEYKIQLTELKSINEAFEYSSNLQTLKELINNKLEKLAELINTYDTYIAEIQKNYAIKDINSLSTNVDQLISKSSLLITDINQLDEQYIKLLPTITQENDLIIDRVMINQMEIKDSLDKLKQNN